MCLGEVLLLEKSFWLSKKKSYLSEWYCQDYVLNLVIYGFQEQGAWHYISLRLTGLRRSVFRLHRPSDHQRPVVLTAGQYGAVVQAFFVACRVLRYVLRARGLLHVKNLKKKRCQVLLSRHLHLCLTR